MTIPSPKVTQLSGLYGTEFISDNVKPKNTKIDRFMKLRNDSTYNGNQINI